MSLWEFAAAASGWAKVNGGEAEKPSSLSDEEHDALMARHA